MAFAYTPGLIVKEYLTIEKKRELPIKGKVNVSLGDIVKAEDIVASVDLPGKVHAQNAINVLSIEPHKLKKHMYKKEGDSVSKGEVIGANKGWFTNTELFSPVDGKIESLSELTGQIIFMENPIPLSLKAYVDGEVIKVVEGEGVIIRANVSYVQGIFGLGGENRGLLKFIGDYSDKKLEEAMLNKEYSDKIIVTSASVTLEALKKAKELDIKGIVAGSVNSKDIDSFLGYHLGVAVTGKEKTGLTLIITEGFGDITMASRTYELLKSKENQYASINGATQIRAGVQRPEVIILSNKGTNIKDEERGLALGSRIRGIRTPYFGILGTVTELPKELTELETGSKVRILKAKLDDGKEAIIPRANIEMV